MPFAPAVPGERRLSIRAACAGVAIGMIAGVEAAGSIECPQLCGTDFRAKRAAHRNSPRRIGEFYAARVYDSAAAARPPVPVSPRYFLNP